MQSTIDVAGGVLVHQPPKSDLTLDLIWPTFGPFPKSDPHTGELTAGACSEVWTLLGDASFIVVSITGAAVLRWGYTVAVPPLPPVLDNELRFCNFGPCPQNGPQVSIPLPVCDMEYLQICAGPDCGIQYDIMVLGV